MFASFSEKFPDRGRGSISLSFRLSKMLTSSVTLLCNAAGRVANLSPKRVSWVTRQLTLACPDARAQDILPTDRPWDRQAHRVLLQVDELLYMSASNDPLGGPKLEWHGLIPLPWSTPGFTALATQETETQSNDNIRSNISEVLISIQAQYIK